MREFNHFDFELNGIIRAFLRTAVNDFMDSVHHIWCPLSSQEFQDLPDGAETTLTFVMTPEIQILIGGLMDKASEGIMLASICHMLQVDTLSELLSLIPTGMPDTDVLDALWRDQKTPAGLNLLDDFVLLDTVALANKRGLLHECIGVD